MRGLLGIQHHYWGLQMNYCWKEGGAQAESDGQMTPGGSQGPQAGQSLRPDTSDSRHTQFPLRIPTMPRKAGLVVELPTPDNSSCSCGAVSHVPHFHSWYCLAARNLNGFLQPSSWKWCHFPKHGHTKNGAYQVRSDQVRFLPLGV